MSERMNANQVQNQMVRFYRLMKTANLLKLGTILMKNGSNVPYYYNFIGKYLSMNNIHQSMYHPKCDNRFYGNILYDVAVRAYFDSLR